jgi:hypothetical protein
MQLSNLKIKAIQMIQANKKRMKLIEKIRNRPELAFQKLIQQNCLTDENIIISKYDKLIGIKATNLLYKFYININTLPAPVLS